MNKGFVEARGDIFGYINADDAYLQGTISDVIETFRKNSGVDVIYGHGYIVDDKSMPIRRFRSDFLPQCALYMAEAQ